MHTDSTFIIKMVQKEAFMPKKNLSLTDDKHPLSIKIDGLDFQAINNPDTNGLLHPHAIKTYCYERAARLLTEVWHDTY